MSSLNNAIQLIREGQKEEARSILESLLKGEPSNIQAWFWYVETLSTVEKRIQVLEVCLKRNPANSQVIQALQMLRSKQPHQESYTPPVPAPLPVVSEPDSRWSPPPVFSAVYDEEPKNSVYFDDTPLYTPVEPAPPQEKSTDKKKAVWDYNDYVDTSTLSRPKPVKRSYAFYDVWLTALAMMNMNTYEDMINDPEAGAGRAFEWMAYSGIISGLLFPLSVFVSPQFAQLRNTPEFRGLFGNMSIAIFAVVLGLAMALLMPIFGVISLAISAGFQNILAGFMGGSGDFGRTAYAIAAYLAPLTILSVALSPVPVVGQCLTSGMGIYNLILNVRALQASHSLSTGKAFGVMFLPAIFLMVFACVILFVLALPGSSN